jgi:hypothetical protein
VEGEHLGSSAGGRADGSGDGVGDVVEFEVEEDGVSPGAKLVDDAIALGQIEFESDLEPLDETFEAVPQRQSLLCVGKVQRNDDALTRGEASRLRAGIGHGRTAPWGISDPIL